MSVAPYFHNRDTRISRDAGNSNNAVNSRKASNCRTMFEMNSRNANNTIGYTRNVSSSRETNNRKPSGT